MRAMRSIAMSGPGRVRRAITFQVSLTLRAIWAAAEGEPMRASQLDPAAHAKLRRKESVWSALVLEADLGQGRIRIAAERDERAQGA